MPLAALTLDDWLNALGSLQPTPAGGALALVTLAGAAALAAKTSRLRGADGSAFEAVARRFLAGAEEDGAAYLAALRRGGRAKRRCLETGFDDLEAALEFLVALGDCAEGLGESLGADLAASGRLAQAAAHTLWANLAVNLSEWSDAVGDLEAAALKTRIVSARRRLEAEWSAGVAPGPRQLGAPAPPLG